VVKLGTITPEGGASVHCYTCQDEVVDNYLKDHLANFGIDVEQQKKTEKTIAELTIDANLNIQLSKLIEEGKILEPIFGPEYTGIDNIGNSCYMSSIIQVLFHIPEV
jgi:ubiquitin carboxyl-terminal hydrolase 5/13